MQHPHVVHKGRASNNKVDRKKKELTKFNEAASNLNLCLSNVKKGKYLGGAMKSLEWCGTSCSGKCGCLFLESCTEIVDKPSQNSIPHRSLQNHNHSTCSSWDPAYFPDWICCLVSDLECNADQLGQILQTLMNELHHLCKMRHENIITLLGVCYESDLNAIPMLVMEAVEFDLCCCLESNALTSWGALCAILQGIASGLVYLHEVHHVLHNNVSTRSVLITKHFIAKLSSFEHATKASGTYKVDISSFGHVMWSATSQLFNTYGSEQLQNIYSLANKCTDQESSLSANNLLDMITCYSKDDQLCKMSTDISQRESNRSLDNSIKCLDYIHSESTDSKIISNDKCADSSSNKEFIDTESQPQVCINVSNTEDGEPQAQMQAYINVSNPKEIDDAETQTHIDEHEDTTSNKELVDAESQTHLDSVLRKEMDNLQKTIKKLTEENEQLIKQVEDYAKKALQIEEESFKFTNSFTTADSRSPLMLGQEYRYIQHNIRPAAGRAHRRAYNNSKPVPFEEHTMLAYEEAKKLVSATFEQYLNSLFNLQEESDADDAQVPESFRLALDKFCVSHPQLENPVKVIQEVLNKAYKNHVKQKDASIPDQVQEYYEKLAKFTWKTVTKAIPMVLSTKCDKFDDSVHEMKDGSDEVVDTSTMIAYIYPTLFTSNSWPREVAMKGRVKAV
ncbi:uncharacterized protein [Dysidea avara]